MAKTVEPKDLKKSESSFNFVGRVRLYKDDKSFAIDETFNSGWTQNKATFNIDTVDGNSFNVQLMGGYNVNDEDPVIRAWSSDRDSDGKSTQVLIPWDERLDDHWLDEISGRSVINVGIIRDDSNHNLVKKFTSGYDAVEYLKEHLETGMVVRCVGNIVWSEYDDVVRPQRNITGIYLSDIEEDGFCANFRQAILVDSASIVEYHKEESVIEMNAYVVDYLSKITVGSGDERESYKVGKNISYLVKFLFDVNKDADIKKTIATLGKYFKPKKKGSLNEVIVDGYFVEGSVTQTASIDDLPDDIKEFIELGLMTEEDALGQLTVGTRAKERELHIKSPALRLVEKDDKQTPTILWTPDRYNDIDLVMYKQIESQYVVNNNDDDDDTVPFAEDVKDDELDEELMALMGM